MVRVYTNHGNASDLLFYPAAPFFEFLMLTLRQAQGIPFELKKALLPGNKLRLHKA